MSHRNFGIMSGARDLGGASISRSAMRDIRPRNSNVIRLADQHPPYDRFNSEASNPPLFILPLEVGNFSETLRNIAALVFVSLFICATGAGLAVGIAILLFVNTTG